MTLYKPLIYPWMVRHVKELEYEKIPFKCKICHKYGYFGKNFSKSPPQQVAHENMEDGNKWRKGETKQILF